MFFDHCGVVRAGDSSCSVRGHLEVRTDIIVFSHVFVSVVSVGVDFRAMVVSVEHDVLVLYFVRARSPLFPWRRRRRSGATDGLAMI